MAAARGGLQRWQQSALQQRAWFPRWTPLHNHYMVSMRTACVTCIKCCKQGYRPHTFEQTNQLLKTAASAR